MLVFFAIFRHITTIKTLQKYFYLVEEVLSFIWWVICENRLTIGFRNAFLWEILQEILQENLVGNFKICKSSAGNAAGNAVGNV